MSGGKCIIRLNDRYQSYNCDRCRCRCCCCCCCTIHGCCARVWETLATSASVSTHVEDACVDVLFSACIVARKTGLFAFSVCAERHCALCVSLSSEKFHWLAVVTGSTCPGKGGRCCLREKGRYKHHRGDRQIYGFVSHFGFVVNWSARVFVCLPFFSLSLSFYPKEDDENGWEWRCLCKYATTINILSLRPNVDAIAAADLVLFVARSSLVFQNPDL